LCNEQIVIFNLKIWCDGRHEYGISDGSVLEYIIYRNFTSDN
jgi:hypothetical protein